MGSMGKLVVQTKNPALAKAKRRARMAYSTLTNSGNDDDSVYTAADSNRSNHTRSSRGSNRMAPPRNLPRAPGNRPPAQGRTFGSISFFSFNISVSSCQLKITQTFKRRNHNDNTQSRAWRQEHPLKLSLYVSNKSGVCPCISSSARTCKSQNFCMSLALRR